ncbi:hypothetical protein AB0L00_16160 [Actinoallomurus sp. NPDC052308]|uniref:hypothetical protein n=1 Tax=Actinoallomurus sp. NPDC052308 TaxID=3155530 RepID=UPI0034272A84
MVLRLYIRLGARVIGPLREVTRDRACGHSRRLSCFNAPEGESGAEHWRDQYQAMFVTHAASSRFGRWRHTTDVARSADSKGRVPLVTRFPLKPNATAQINIIMANNSSVDFCG